jgi:hypothetical protein
MMKAKRPTKPEDIPNIIPILPLNGALLLPHTHRPLNIFEPRYIELIEEALSTNRLVGLIQPDIKEQKQAVESPESPDNNAPLAKIGTLGRIVHFEEIDEERFLIILEGVARFSLGEEIFDNKPYRLFQINTKPFINDFLENNIEQPNIGNFDDIVDKKKFLSTMRQYAKFANLDINWEQVEQTPIDDLINITSMVGPYNAKEKQLLLEAKTLDIRAQTLIALAELEMKNSSDGVVLQ